MVALLLLAEINDLLQNNLLGSCGDFFFEASPIKTVLQGLFSCFLSHGNKHFEGRGAILSKLRNNYTSTNRIMKNLEDITVMLGQKVSPHYIRQLVGWLVSLAFN